mmetsp:Transcript_74085/g.163606  ORF Transcript_74085/g.163606 Transcript_74085/m.163606 type:complete len:225 (-) Transcript_74085:325-999(-)
MMKILEDFVPSTTAFLHQTDQQRRIVEGRRLHVAALRQVFPSHRADLPTALCRTHRLRKAAVAQGETVSSQKHPHLRRGHVRSKDFLQGNPRRGAIEGLLIEVNHKLDHVLRFHDVNSSADLLWRHRSADFMVPVLRLAGFDGLQRLGVDLQSLQYISGALELVPCEELLFVVVQRSVKPWGRPWPVIGFRQVDNKKPFIGLLLRSFDLPPRDVPVDVIISLLT